MRFPTTPCRRLLVPALFLSLSSLGCGGGHNAVQKERELDQLRFENARRRESIIESLAESERWKREVSDLTAARENLAKQVGELSTTLKSTNDKLVSTIAHRDELKSKLAEAEKSADRLRESADKVRSIASASAGELADLRLKKQELEEQVRRFLQSQNSLGEENKSLSSQAHDLKEELVRTKAVLRSLREGNGDQTEINALEAEVTQLKKKCDNLQGEKLALEKRLEASGVAGAAGAATATPTIEVSRQEPQRLLAEVAALVRDRYEGAVAGKFTWDYIDFALIGVVVVFFLGLVWATVRWWRLRKLRKQVRTLTARVRELEQARAADTAANGGPRSDRPRPSVRRSGFSAVIPKKDIAESASPLPAAPVVAEEEEEMVLEDEREPVLAGAAAPQKGHSDSSARRIVGARSWERPASRGEEEAADDLAHTQVIGRLEAEPVAAAPARPDPARSAKKTDESKDDVELLAELKAVINKKFDELMK
jgi:peptidoglycan hydrolase CwlO-like protein